MPSPNESRLMANGCDMPIEVFQDRIVDIMAEMFRSWSIDELLLHPRDGMEYCSTVRRTTGFHDLPDDLILRILLNRRKSP